MALIRYGLGPPGGARVRGATGPGRPCLSAGAEHHAHQDLKRPTRRPHARVRPFRGNQGQPGDANLDGVSGAGQQDDLDPVIALGDGVPLARRGKPGRVGYTRHRIRSAMGHDLDVDPRFVDQWRDREEIGERQGLSFAGGNGIIQWMSLTVPSKPSETRCVRSSFSRSIRASFSIVSPKGT